MLDWPNKTATMRKKIDVGLQGAGPRGVSLGASHGNLRKTRTYMMIVSIRMDTPIMIMSTVLPRDDRSQQQIVC